MNKDFFLFTSQYLVRAPQGITFRVFYLEAPLSFLGKKLGLDTVAPNLVTIAGFHTAIGFQSTDATFPLEFYLDFLSNDIFTLLPKVITTNTGEETLVWDNYGLVTIGKDINRSYWEASNYICNISAENLVKYQEWVLTTFIPKNPRYVFNRVTQGITREALFHPILRSSTCDDFCLNSFDYMQSSLNVCINFITPTFESISAFSVASHRDIQEVNFNDTATRREIVGWYSRVIAASDKIFGATLEVIREQIENDIANVDNPDLIRRMIEQDQKSLHFLLWNSIMEFGPYIYLYTYNNQGQMAYFKIKPNDYILTYIETDLKRNNRSMDIFHQPVDDPYTLPPGNIDHGLSGCVSNEEGVTLCYSLTPNTIGYAITAITIALMLILVILFVWYNRPKN